jgi:hypothetical protein
MAYTTIDKPSSYFNTKLYTGTGSSLANTGIGFKPDFVWVKSRSDATDHALYDSNRGVQKDLISNSTATETTQTTGLTSFDSDGFTVGALAKLNTSSSTYISWNWLGSNTTSSNTSGTITSTVCVNQTNGFSIVKWTGNGTVGATVGHGLGVAPAMFIVKDRNVARSWVTYHKSIGNTGGIDLSATSGVTTGDYNYWNNTSPTSSVFSVSTYTNENASNYVTYCFAETKGFSKFNSFTGNSSTDGVFNYTGFKPAYVMIRNLSNGYRWCTFDNKRNTYNVAPTFTYLEGNFAEATTTGLDFLSNGFKLRDSGASFNGSGSTYIYWAFAENPFVSSKGIPCTAR